MVESFEPALESDSSPGCWMEVFGGVVVDADVVEENLLAIMAKTPAGP
jgi:hypothetical protein